MPTWHSPSVGQLVAQKGGRGTKPCTKCHGYGEVPRTFPMPLLGTTKRCPRCGGEGRVKTSGQLRLERRAKRDWDIKQKVANNRPKSSLW